MTNTNEYSTIINQMTANHYRHVKTSWARGYISRRGAPIIKPYSGRYGIGYTVETPSWQSTQYHRIAYFITSDPA